LAAAAAEAGTRIEVLLDLDVGQHRTGIAPGPAAVAIYRELARTASLIPGGLHAYDGHLSQSDPNEREAACKAAFAPVVALRDELRKAGLPAPKVVAGGSPTFPFLAARREFECSPGTVVLWDASSALTLPDMELQNAAVLLTRVVSKPLEDYLCLDLGHKAVAAEMPHPRVIFPDLPDAEAVKHSEEHLLLKTPRARKFAVGDQLLGVPWHICPSLALHAEAVMVERGKITGSWPIEARARRLTI
jgi:D-serine deaminase-like pyridoxal phosphate-dependent protein